MCGLADITEGVTVERFLGIPYAETTAGENRFAPPVAKAAWQGVLEATRFGSICPQNDAPVNENLVQSEDCLSLNIWRPESATPASPKPVLVFIPGGAFVTGSSADRLVRGSDQALYDGSYLAATENLVVVTLNYRLGALAFLAGVARLEGNFGFLDQQLALRWVRENIGVFGGNPNAVTLAGESAGALSAALHLLSAPASEGLFTAAILESAPLAIPYRTLQDATTLGELYLLGVGCQFRFDQLGCLRSKSVEELLEGQRNPLLRLPVLDFGLSGFLTWAPVLDGEVVVRQPLAAAEEGHLTKPVLLGTNTQEGTIFFVTPNARPLSRFGYETLTRSLFGQENYRRVFRQYPPTSENTDQAIQIADDYLFTCSNRAFARAARGPVYLYQFTHVPSFNIFPDIPRCADESCHADELAFVFHSAASPFAFTPEEEVLSRAMARYWGRFASVLHNPNVGIIGAPEWPRFGEAGAHLVLDTPIAVRSDAPEECVFWDELGYALERRP